MSDTTFLQVQAAQLRRLLADAGDDRILVPQLKKRIEIVEQELARELTKPGQLIPSDPPKVLPRTAFFLRGDSVSGNSGIRPALAGEALLQYEKMFVEQAIHDERIAARASGRKRRPKGAPTPALLFTGTPRGSFGLEFTPQITEDNALNLVHSESLISIADTMVRIAECEEGKLDAILESIPSRVIHPMTQFFRLLSVHGAEVRLASSAAASKSLTVEQVRSASSRLDRDVSMEQVSLTGIMRGITLETGHFDFLADGERLISGYVAEDLSEDDLEYLDTFTNVTCNVTLEMTTVRNRTGDSTATYVLVRAIPSDL